MSPIFPDLKLVSYIENIPSKKPRLSALWIWMKTNSELVLRRISTWASKDKLSSKATDIKTSGINTQTQTSMNSVDSNPGMLKKVSAKVSDLKHSIYFPQIPPIQKGVYSLWGWIKKTPDPILRRAKYFWDKRSSGENVKEVYDDEVMQGKVFEVTKGCEETPVGGVAIKPLEDLGGSSESERMEDVVQDKYHDLSSNLKSKSKADVKKLAHSATHQNSAASQSNCIPGEKKQISESDREAAQYYSSILRLSNKKKFLPIEVTEEEYQHIKPSPMNEEILDFMKDNSSLSDAEFERRATAMYCQINQFKILEMMNDQGGLIPQRIKIHLLSFQADIPWGNFSQI
ncbi:uncharacterized protein MELLADRAFT_70154 [Melampsora larici-populina 98AG31]|uniref:Uncharacterized protein n=1 Tax=Melampsora larici-populina (strain 98AG31 / pathotype 3-4-7) TaxID=747676 RepID=F4SDT9_MELLP|nr:uncharacterized protein MELLADRAFT_70154 [Melampsora larici-populina 98AG31]EGF97188.1 hypothetical protein MELLADRAFT_70154 [Melampsora larici-populina 98AG31]